MLYLMLLLIALLSYFAGIWWLFVPLTLVGAYIWAKTAGQAFAAGFLANSLVWLGFILLRTLSNQNLLAKKVAYLFSMPNWVALLLAAAIVAGLLGGLAAWAGFFVKQVRPFRLTRTNTYHA